MATFKVTPTELVESSHKCDVIAEKLGKLLGESDAFINQLLTIWEGDTSTNYAERYQSLKPRLYEAVQLFDDMAKSLATTAQAYETASVNIAESFSNPI